MVGCVYFPLKMDYTLIIVRGEELVAPDSTPREHHPAAWSEDAPAETKIWPWAHLCSTQQQLRLFNMDTMGVLDL